MKFKFILFVLFLIFASSNCSRILFVHPSFSRSHVLPLQVLAKQIAKDGHHHVTFISQFPLTEVIPYYRDIAVKMSSENDKHYKEASQGMTKSINMIKMLQVMKKLIFSSGNDTIQSETVQKLMKEETFDLVVIGYFVTEFLLGFADHFKCPSIIFFSGSHLASISKLIGNPVSPEAALSAVSTSKGTGFIGRTKNFLMAGFELFLIRVLLHYPSKEVYK